MVRAFWTRRYAEFDLAITRLLFYLGDMSEETRKEITGAIKEKAKETIHSATEIAEACYSIVDNGRDTKQSIIIKIGNMLN